MTTINIKLMRYYIYAYVDTTKSINAVYETSMGSYHFEFEPIYIGKGNGDRGTDHQKGSHNLGLNEVIKSGNFKYIELEYGIPSHFAYLLENELIYHIGRKDLGKGPLTNISSGIHLVEAKHVAEIGPLHLEFNKMLHVLKVLNQTKTIKEAAGLLDISERSLYRYLKGYKIVRDKVTKEFYQDPSSIGPITHSIT